MSGFDAALIATWGAVLIFSCWTRLRKRLVGWADWLIVLALSIPEEVERGAA